MSAAMLKGARKRAEKLGDAVSFAHSDEPFLAIPYSDGHFHAVVSTFAFHHLRDELKPKAVAEMSRVLVPDGRIVLGDVFFANAAERREALLRWSDELEDEYCRALSEAGMGSPPKAGRKIRLSWVSLRRGIHLIQNC